MAKRSNIPATGSSFLKFLHELFSTKNKNLKQNIAPHHSTCSPSLKPITESIEPSALSQQLKDRTRKFAILFSRANVKDEAKDQVEIFGEHLEKPKLQSEKESEDRTLNSQGNINSDKSFQESDNRQNIETKVPNMFLDAPKALSTIIPCPRDDQ